MKQTITAGAGPCWGRGLVAFARRKARSPFARKFAALSVLTGAGQLCFVAALPLLSRLYTPAQFGAFAIYLAFVNLAGPLLSLKFDSALYAATSREQAARTLAVALAALAVMAGTTGALVWLMRSLVLRGFGEAGAAALYLLPFGMFLAGAWTVSSAWAVRAEASSTLGAARFVQPFLMTAIQLAAGLIAPSAGALLAAHLVSHIAYCCLVAYREVTRADLAALRALRAGEMLRLAWSLRQFPLFALPAQVSSLSVSNLPPILLSVFYGAGVAGHFGIAYRLVIAPLTIASLPLGALLIGGLVRAHDGAESRRLIRRVFGLNAALIGLPLLLLGITAAPLAARVLGENWAMTGQIVTALCLLGAAQALAAPFSEATSIFARPHLRFVMEAVAAAVVLGALIGCGLAGVSALPAIWAMSVGGAVCSTGGLLFVLSGINHSRRSA